MATTYSGIAIAFISFSLRHIIVAIAANLVAIKGSLAIVLAKWVVIVVVLSMLLIEQALFSHLN